MGMRGLFACSAMLMAGIVACGSAAGVAATSASASSASRAAAPTPTPTPTPTPSATAAAAAAAVLKPETKAAATSVSAAIVREGLCTAPATHRALASRLSADIWAGLRGRVGAHAVSVYDRVTGVYCVFNGSKHFDSASIVKAIILATLMRWHQQTRTALSAWEKSEATLMITQSDNDAATDLWDELGMANLQHFLNLANMGETQLGQDGYWGLTQVTAHDEMLLLKLLTAANSVLDAHSRAYQLGLMGQVVNWEAWGVTAGTPSGVTWHVKNGWLPDATGWHINSIGAFTGHGKDYMMAVLSANDDDDDDEQYGINTIQDVARRVQHDLNDATLTAPSSTTVTTGG
jgi:Beta-lactamase enzyme family